MLGQVTQLITLRDVFVWIIKYLLSDVVIVRKTAFLIRKVSLLVTVYRGEMSSCFV